MNRLEVIEWIIAGLILIGAVVLINGNASDQTPAGVVSMLNNRSPTMVNVLDLSGTTPQVFEFDSFKPEKVFTDVQKYHYTYIHTTPAMSGEFDIPASMMQWMDAYVPLPRPI